MTGDKLLGLTDFHSDKINRVAIFVDNDKFFISLKEAGISFVDYRKIFLFSKRFGRIDLARVYLSKTNPEVEGRIRKAGFDVKYVSTNGHKRSNVDTQMIVDMMRYQSDIYIIVTGALDFEPAVRQLKADGGQVIVVHLKENTSTVLQASAHKFIDYRDI